MVWVLHRMTSVFGLIVVWWLTRTDRILFHSLPDIRDDLKVLHYSLCDAILGSDHRPISAAFELTFLKFEEDTHFSDATEATPPPPALHQLHQRSSSIYASHNNSKINDSHGKDSPSSPPPEGEGCHLDQLALSNSRWDITRDLEEEEDEARVPPPCMAPVTVRTHTTSSTPATWRRNRTFTCKITNFSFDVAGAADPANVRLASLAEGENAPEFPPAVATLKRHDTSNSSGSRGLVVPSLPISLWRGESSTSYLTASKSELVPRLEDQIDSVVVLMPIPCEDPFMADRRVVLLDIYSSGLTDHDSTMNETGRHVHRLLWSEVQSQGIRVTATVLGGMGLHAVIKLVDKQGMDLGQACLCLGALFQKSRQQRLQHGGSSRVTTRMQLPLSSGGVYKGKVSFDVSLRERRLRY